MSKEMQLELAELLGMGMLSAESMVDTAEQLAEGYGVEVDSELPIAVCIDANSLNVKLLNGSIDELTARQEMQGIIKRALLVRDEEVEPLGNSQTV